MAAIHVKKHIRLLGVLIAGALAIIFTLLHISVGAIARGYMSNDPSLQSGMIVALSVDGSNDSNVERATPGDSSRVVGVVTTIDNSLVTLSSGTAKVLVESEGQVEAYVSDINGEISQGDILVLSSLKGILMKSSDDETAVVGIAAETPVTESSYSYEDGNQTKNTNIAKIKINLNQKWRGVAQAIPPPESALAKLGRSLTGKEVEEIRVLIAVILFVIVLIAEGGIIYGAISSAIIALGRNPLAGKIVKGELIRVIIIALGVLLVGLGAVYAVLYA